MHPLSSPDLITRDTPLHTQQNTMTCVWLTGGNVAYGTHISRLPVTAYLVLGPRVLVESYNHPMAGAQNCSYLFWKDG